MLINPQIEIKAQFLFEMYRDRKMLVSLRDVTEWEKLPFIEKQTWRYMALSLVDALNIYEELKKCATVETKLNKN